MPFSQLPETFKKIVRPFYYLYQRKLLFVYNLLYGKKPLDYQNIPIVINNYNRLTFLLQLIQTLEKRGYKNIHIIDNASTYPPLLTYYKRCPYKVHQLAKNMGHLALWQSGLYKLFWKSYYVYTDSDIVLTNECPQDFMKLFLEKLQSDYAILKVGFSLKIDDLPDHYIFKPEVIENEKKFFQRKQSHLFYHANIDTTFALYRPGAKGGSNIYHKMYRSGFPYEARHMPWYVDSKNPDEEETFYLSSVCQETQWSLLSKKIIDRMMKTNRHSLL